MRSLVLVVALCAALAAVHATIHNCTTKQIGAPGEAIELPTVITPPGKATFSIKVDQWCHHMKGAKVTACDSDVAPDVEFPAADEVLVTRLSTLATEANITVTIYCGLWMQSVFGA